VTNRAIALLQPSRWRLALFALANPDGVSARLTDFGQQRNQFTVAR